MQLIFSTIRSSLAAFTINSIRTGPFVSIFAYNNELAAGLIVGQPIHIFQPYRMGLRKNLQT